MPLFLIVLLTLLVGGTEGAIHQVTDADLRSAVVSLRRENRCGFVGLDPHDLQQCPSYSITIAGDGTVTYEGWAGVRTLGKHTHRIAIEAVRGVVGEFIQADFFSMRDRYEGLDLGNGTMRVIDHSAAATVALSMGGKTKSIYDFYGAPAALTLLERRVDEVSESARYTGRPPNPGLEPTAVEIHAVLATTARRGSGRARSTDQHECRRQ
ncbi:MAG: DUF6438 domain-containing protein [Hyphomicrobium sp.]|jgi:hypothetical protein